MESTKLIVSIVERGQGAALEKLYRKNYVTLHLQCAGRGTATSEIMDILGLGSSEKDLVLSCAAASAARRLLRALDSDLRRSVKGSGLVFSLPMSGVSSLAANLAAYLADNIKPHEKEDADMERTENSLILITCSRGSTDDVMATARAHGARGGTVVKARLAGLEDLEQAYDTQLQEEREILGILVPTEQRGAIMEAVNAEHGLRSEAQVIQCSLPVEEVVRI